MIKNLRKKINNKRNSKNLFWKSFFVAKDYFQIKAFCIFIILLNFFLSSKNVFIPAKIKNFLGPLLREIFFLLKGANIENSVFYIRENISEEIGNAFLAKIFFDERDYFSSFNIFQKINLEKHEGLVPLYLSLLVKLKKKKEISLFLKRHKRKGVNAFKMWGISYIQSLKTLKKYDELIKIRNALDVKKDRKLIYNINGVLGDYNHIKKVSSASVQSRIKFIVLDYKNDCYSNSSLNMGDYIQTVAAINILKENFYFRFDEKILNDVFSNKKADQEAELWAANRDLIYKTKIPKNYFLIIYGWHMHETLDLERHIDILGNAENVLIISLHINTTEVLSEKTVKFLKKHAPIGCRDYATEAMLKSKGIEAYFSGCLTLTLDMLDLNFSTRGAKKKKNLVIRKNTLNKIKYILKMNDARYSSNTDLNMPLNNFNGNVLNSLFRLKEIKEADSLYTDKLHCYLPALAFNVRVKFCPEDKKDIRFYGLYPLSSKEISKIQKNYEKIFENVSDYFKKNGKDKNFLSGTDIKAVSLDLTKPELKIPDIKSCLNKNLKEIKPFIFGREEGKKKAINLLLCFDDNMREQIKIILESIFANSNYNNWTVNLFTRKIDIKYISKLAEGYDKKICIKAFDLTDLKYKLPVKTEEHITISTMDRLLAPLLLHATDKVLYLDMDIIVLGDLKNLYVTNLGNHAVGARKTNYSSWGKSYKIYDTILRRIGPSKYIKMADCLFGGRVYEFECFNAGILLLDLKKMRQNKFTETYLPISIYAQINDQFALNMYAKELFYPINSVWNTRPVKDIDMCGAKIIHWAGKEKPWNCTYIRGKRFWKKYKK